VLGIAQLGQLRPQSKPGPGIFGKCPEVDFRDCVLRVESLFQLASLAIRAERSVQEGVVCSDNPATTSG
jgi:hypothetical protein